MSKRIYEREWYAALSGFCCIGLGLGLCRVAFAPIVPSLVDFHWVTLAEAGTLGSANFGGYLAGVLVIIWIARRVDRQLLLRGALIVATLSLFGCAWNFGVVWLSVLRALQGFAGATLMTFVPGLVLQSVAPHRQRLIGGFTMSGLGGFTLAASLLIPVVGTFPATEWGLYGILALGVTIFAWPFLGANVRGVLPPANQDKPLERSDVRPYVAFLVAYGLLALAAVPNIVFLADYLHQGLGLTGALSSWLFAIFGVGLVLGGFSGGLIAHRLGTYATVLIMSLLLVGANLVTVWSRSVDMVAGASLVFALGMVATVALASLRTLEIVGHASMAKYWARMCAGYAIGQLAGSLLFTRLIQAGYGYLDLFWVAEGSLVAMMLFFALSFRSAASPGSASQTGS